MVQHRRSHVAGDTFFFTVKVCDRPRALLIDHVDALRNIMRGVKVKLPYTIDAMVVLLDHWHAVWTLPPDDLAYSQRIRLIKAGFTKHLLRKGAPIEKDAGGEYKL